MIIAIDPGVSGGIACFKGGRVICCAMPQTFSDIHKALSDLSQGVPQCRDRVFLEKVHAMPGNGVVSMFTFGENYGYLRGVCHTLRYSIEDVPPQAWQKALQCGSKGKIPQTEWKNLLKNKAQQLYPDLRVTLATADALLILEWAKRFRGEFT